MECEIERVGSYFEKEWDRYQGNVRNDVLCHREMFSTLDTFLRDSFGDSTFSLADFGCGDCSSIRPVLAGKPITRFIGVDSAPGLIQRSHSVLAESHYEKQLFCKDMRVAIKELAEPVQVIFSSYALHHLQYEEKVEFIANCQKKLSDTGFFVLVDGVLDKNMDRDAWLLELETRMRESPQALTNEAVDVAMAHPRDADFPDSIATFEDIAHKQGWASFEVKVDKGIFAFMIFGKNTRAQ